MNVFDNISGPLLFKCTVCPFKYLFVNVLSCCIDKWRWHRLFPKGRFGVVLHVFISCTMKNFHINLTLFQWMRDLKSSNMFASIIIKGYHFFICFKVGSFCAIVLGHFSSDFLWKWASFVFFLNWYTQSIAILINEIFDKSIIYNLW